MKLITLSGVSGSGKSSVRDWLVEYYGFSKTVDATTRAARIDSELDEYVFYTPTQMLQARKRGAFIEFLEYNGELYGILNNLNTLNSDYIVAVTLPEGVRQLKEYAHDNNIEICSVKININTRTQRERLINRGDNIESIEKRLSDGVLFRLDKTEYDIEIDADTASVKEVADYIYNKINKGNTHKT